MTRLAFIPLDGDWQYQYIYLGDDELADGIRGETNLSEWEPLVSQNWSVWLNHDFELAPLDDCARYFLHIDALPGAIWVVLGEKRVADVDAAPVVLDVTENVALEENTLRLRLDLATVEEGKRLGPVWLEAVPCD